MAINKMLWFCRDQVCNVRVDALVDNQAVIHAWNNRGGRSVALNNALKVLFATTDELNVFLCLFYVWSAENPADGPSRRLSPLDYCLTDRMWQNVQQDFGVSSGHTFDLMALDSNVMKDRFANSLPHLHQVHPQGLRVSTFLRRIWHSSVAVCTAHMFSPPSLLVGSVLRFLG